ncbi:hypothetical protein Vadar_009706 [Vaccinium darrowii]|uniref:Uncharacterized protein n=1 Tax=Vaccinium darrowii TaxID=229202 RepID=A0ACB7YL15_9ERIC|nr:hypothetical protein Vadar_009706 [Vaccinium darrowii]
MENSIPMSTVIGHQHSKLSLIGKTSQMKERDRKGIPRFGTCVEVKLKFDEKFLLLDYPQTLYQNLHQLNQQPNQSVVDYTEQFYQLLSHSNLCENDDQLVARLKKSGNGIPIKIQKVQKGVSNPPKDGAEKIFDDEECSKTTAMVAKIDLSKPPIYDEDPKDKDIAWHGTKSSLGFKQMHGR